MGNVCLGTGWAMLDPREPAEGQQEMVTGEADRARGCRAWAATPRTGDFILKVVGSRGSAQSRVRDRT